MLLEEWMFSEENDFSLNGNFSLNGITALSAFVKLEQGYPASGGPPGEGEAAWTWIKFEISTHLRVGNGALRNVDFGSALTDALAVDIELIETLQSELQLPEEVTLIETTPFEEEVVTVSVEGEESGRCSVDGCECGDAYILVQEDGSCKLKEQKIPIIFPTPAPTIEGETTEYTSTTEDTTTTATTTSTATTTTGSTTTGTSTEYTSTTEETTTTATTTSTATTTTGSTTTGTSTVSTTPATIIDCYDGNNGGCSHYCNHVGNTCDCPPCWTLQDDKTSCLPASDKISVTCAQDGMTIDVDKCVYNDGADVVTIGFSEDPTCQSIEYNGTLSITTALDECGVQHSTGDGIISFSNTLTVLDRINPNGLMLTNDIDYNVECLFSTVVDHIHSTLTVTSPVQTSGTSGAGVFEFVAEYYTNDQFTSVSHAQDVMVVGETLNFGIRPKILVSGMLFYVNDCAVSDDNGNSYNIIEDMYPDSVVVQNTSGFTSSNLFTMKYYAFQFAGTYDNVC